MADLNAERETGIRAQRLLDDPILKGAYESIRASILDKWPRAQDAESREALWQEMHALDAVWRKLNTLVQTGRMADEQLSRGKR